MRHSAGDIFNEFCSFGLLVSEFVALMSNSVSSSTRFLVEYSHCVDGITNIVWGVEPLGFD